MPIYVYKCNSCETSFEVFRSMTDKSEQGCTACEAADTQRQITSPNFILRGDGWVGKNIRIKNQMSRKNRGLAVKEREFCRDSKEMQSMRVQPNFNGEQTGSWAEAQKIASSKGKDASSYNALVTKEKRGDL